MPAPERHAAAATDDSRGGSELHATGRRGVPLKAAARARLSTPAPDAAAHHLKRVARSSRMNSMNRFSLMLFLLAATFCWSATAADTSDPERVLFPVWTDFPVEGVNGSKWVADATITNPGSNAIGVYPIV